MREPATEQSKVDYSELLEITREVLESPVPQPCVQLHCPKPPLGTHGRCKSQMLCRGVFCCCPSGFQFTMTFWYSHLHLPRHLLAQFYLVLGIEPRASRTLDNHSTKLSHTFSAQWHFLVFWDKVSLYSTGCFEIVCIDQVGLQRSACLCL